MLKKMEIDKFINELASDSPAPGGGSAACLTGALGAGLAAMVSRLTVGKEGYEDLEDFFKEKIVIFDKLKNKLVELIDKDANAFNGVMAAFKLPKDTPKNKAKRSAKIQEEYKNAALIPMNTVRTCNEVFKNILDIGTKGNKNALSDIAVGALNAVTGLKSAALNVEINLPSIKDEKFKEEISNELNEIKKGLDDRLHIFVKDCEAKF